MGTVNKDHLPILIVCIAFIIVQCALGLFDPIESRSNHGEHLSHFQGAATNMFDGQDVDCSSAQDELSTTAHYPERGGCWHYRSRSVLSEAIYAPPLILDDGYVGLKIYTLLLSVCEIVLLYALVKRHLGAERALVTGIVYAVIPAFNFYAQMPHPVHLNVIVTLCAALYSVPLLIGERKLNSTERFVGWFVLLVGPFADNFLAFAWAGIALGLFIRYRLSRRDMLWKYPLLLSIPVIWFFVHLWLNSILGNSSDSLLNRLGPRSDPMSFLDPGFLLQFSDTLSNQIGPLGFFIMISSLLGIKQFRQIPAEIQIVIISLGSMAFWTTAIFQVTFVSCCPYFAYPIVATLAAAISCLRLPRLRFQPLFALLIVSSMVAGLNLHNMPENYVERSLQEYVHDHITDPDATVVIDNSLAGWNGFRWSLPNGSIHIHKDASNDTLRHVVEHRNPDHFILSNQAFIASDANQTLTELGYCIMMIETDPHVPDSWEAGWLSDRLPVWAAWRCGE